jgi:hypothetical protein
MEWAGEAGDDSRTDPRCTVRRIADILPHHVSLPSLFPIYRLAVYYVPCMWMVYLFSS